MKKKPSGPATAGPTSVFHRLTAGRRLFLCAVFGGAVYALGPAAYGLPFRIALGWILGVALYLGLTLCAISDASAAHARQRARQEDEYAWVIFCILIAAAAVSLLALGFLVRGGTGGSAVATVLRLSVAGFAVLASWVLTHTTFAFRYAHWYYSHGKDGHDSGGLAFPEEKAPDYWDFLYFSFVIGMTCQVSDVQVTARPMRRLALAHGVLSFLFNTVILALAINFLASTI